MSPPIHIGEFLYFFDIRLISALRSSESSIEYFGGRYKDTMITGLTKVSSLMATISGFSYTSISSMIKSFLAMIIAPPQPSIRSFL